MRVWSWLLAVAITAPTGAEAATCLQDNAEAQAVQGKLTVQTARDAAGKTEKPYMLTLSAPACLDSAEADNRVPATITVQVFSTNETVQAAFGKFVGKSIMVRGRPFSAHTAHHHAPIVMDVSEIVIK